jgi:hypothetical protein
MVFKKLNYNMLFALLTSHERGPVLYIIPCNGRPKWNCNSTIHMQVLANCNNHHTKLGYSKSNTALHPYKGNHQCLVNEVTKRKLVRLYRYYYSWG